MAWFEKYEEQTKKIKKIKSNLMKRKFPYVASSCKTKNKKRKKSIHVYFIQKCQEL